MGQVKVAENKRLINDSANPPLPEIAIPGDQYLVERSIACLDTFRLFFLWCMTQCRKSHTKKAEGGDLLDRLP